MSRFVDNLASDDGTMTDQRWGFRKLYHVICYSRIFGACSLVKLVLTGENTGKE